MSINICTAILAINSAAQVSVEGEDYEQITWHAGTTVISKADIQAKITELQTAYDALEYQRQRQPEYPDIGDQLDALYHAGVFPTDMAAQIKAVKDKYAKE